jgi:hypothetical protein
MATLAVAAGEQCLQSSSFEAKVVRRDERPAAL